LDKEVKDLDILVFGAHPDDVELGCAGTIMLHLDLGFRVGIIDLTRGELGTRGSAEIRDKESEKASSLMGISYRLNLHLKDGFFNNNESTQLEIIKYIRRLKPKVVIANATEDRHPDHGRASNLIKTCCFLSGLSKIETKFENKKQTPWRPKNIYYYSQFNQVRPDFLIDISSYMQKKIDIVKCYSSQFYAPKSKEPETVISKKGFLDSVVYRSSDLGRIIGVEYAEGFVSERYFSVENLFKLK